MNQRIAHHIEADQDLCAFRVVCKATRDAIDGDNLSFWRRRFLGTFEKATGYKSNKAYKEAYQKRKKAMKFGADFKRGSSRREKACLEVLRDLILGKFDRSLPIVSGKGCLERDRLAHNIQKRTRRRQTKWKTALMNHSTSTISSTSPTTPIFCSGFSIHD